MHELSIAQALVDSMREEAVAHPGARVTRVGVRVGEVSGVQPDALEFAFGIVVKGTEIEQATLDIERVALRQHCEACAREFPVAEFTLACPACGAATRAVAGDELQMTYLELE